ncbi:hypothetical protein [Streptomyces sp. NPDC023838]|uniref:hypothetical protein n=1 Tax=Streptomyces sp. NPDC023838 TaxID=3154325 RepID=UPI0033E9B08C
MAVASPGPAEVIARAATPDTLFPQGAEIGTLSMFGVDAVVAYRQQGQECERRARAGMTKLNKLHVLELLMNLPLGESVALASLGDREKRVLRQVPNGALVRHDRAVVREATHPLRVDLAVVPGSSWTAAKEKAEWFTPFCARAVMVDRPLRRRDDAVMEAEFYGIGLLVAVGRDVEVVVPPRPFVRRRHTAAGWQFLEEAYNQLCR